MPPLPNLGAWRCAFWLLAAVEPGRRALITLRCRGSPLKSRTPVEHRMDCL